MANTLSNNEKIFKFFEGEWELLRKVTGPNRDEIANEMNGTASFTKQDNGNLLYEETVQINERSIGTEKYLFVLSDAGISQYRFEPSAQRNDFPFTEEHPDAIKMYDLNFAQFVSSQQMMYSGRYSCGPDTYDVTYCIGDDSFLTTYKIIGTYKHMHIDTSYTRIEEPELLGTDTDY